MTALERAARAAGDVAATLDSDVRHLLTEGALERVARAVLLAVRVPSDKLEEIGAPWTDNVLPGSAFTAMIDAILSEGQP